MENQKMKRLALVTIVAVVLGALPSHASACVVNVLKDTPETTPAASERIGFYCITNNSPVNAAIGEAQFFADLTKVGNEVEFRFENTGPEKCTIGQVYFDGSVLHGITSIINPAGVDFEKGANPGDLPGGNSITPKFETTPGLLAGADNPAPQNGVNAGEHVGLVFSLSAGCDFQDVVDAIQSGELRIGIHAISFAPEADKDVLGSTCGGWHLTPGRHAPNGCGHHYWGWGDCGNQSSCDSGDGGSESFINKPCPTPEPATLSILAMGLLFFRPRSRKTC
jgi:hypothetical protein